MAPSEPTVTKLDVQRRLWTKLINNARKLLNEPDLQGNFDKDRLERELLTAVNKVAFREFTNAYNYNFNNDASATRPPNATGEVKTQAHLCSIEDPVKNPGQARDYINGLFKTVINLPGWMQDNASNDLIAIADVLLHQPQSLEWRTDKYTRTFDAALEEQKSYKTDTIITFANFTLDESGFKPTFCIIYFMNVYYEVNSKTKVARGVLQNESYSKYKDFDSSPGVIRNQNELEKAISKIAASQFKDRFGYQYTEKPPDMLSGVSPTLAKNATLAYVPDPKKPGMDGFVDYQLFKGLAFKDEYLKGKIRTGILEQLNAAAQNPRSKSWWAQWIDQIYTPSIPASNMMKGHGIVITYYDTQTVNVDSGSQTVSILYIFVLAVFYEVQSLNQSIARDVFADLVKNLGAHLDGEPPVFKIDDPETIKRLMMRYLKQQFKDTFNFDWVTDDGKIPNSDLPAITLSGLLDFVDYPPAPQNIQARVDATGFERSGLNFPKLALQEKAWDSLLKLLQFWTGPHAPAEFNHWYSQHRVGPMFAFNAEYDVKEYTFFLYALGDRSSGNTSIKRPFVSYISMYGLVKKGWPGKESSELAVEEHLQVTLPSAIPHAPI